MPEGDSLHRAAQRLQPLVGERLRAESPSPRAAATGVAERIDGLRLDAVEAVGKNLLLRFEGGVVVRSHLGMHGRWRLERAGAARAGRPWLVLRGREHEAVLSRGSALELVGSRPPRLGPDVLAPAFDLDAAVARLRAAPPSTAVGEALLAQRLVAGIGNLWRAEALWAAEVSPWRPLADLADDDLRRALAAARGLMRASLAGRRPPRRVYRRAGRPCPRCGTPIRSAGQGDANRTAYWCPNCQ
ncbi:MAG: DNA glycosylase [Thermoleophilia bacterium]|nr:DNA glycosylase [Thermoleophilia bacterium]